MYARACDLAHRIQTRQARTTGQIGRDAAHQVVGGRRHRNGLARPVPAALAHGGVDRREPSAQELRGAFCAAAAARTESRGIQQHGTAVLRGHDLGNGAGDDVARRELGIRVHVEHEAAVLVVAQDRALAADGLGYEKRVCRALGGEHSRMELDELEIDHRRPRAQRRGDAVSCRDRWVRGVRVELPRTPRREHDRVRREHLAARVVAPQVDARCASCRPVDDEVDEERVLDDSHRARAQTRDEGFLDRGAGGIPARVQDAGVRVRRLETLHEVTVRRTVELDTERDQLTDAAGALLGEHADGVGIAESRTGDEGVVDVILDTVVVEHDPCDAALRVAGVGVFEDVLRHERHATTRIGSVQRRGQPGDTGPDHHGLERGHGFAASMRSRAVRAGSATSPGTSMRLTTRPATSSSRTQAR